MGFWQQVKNLFGGEKRPTQPSPAINLADDEPEIAVPEISVEELYTMLAKEPSPLMIDVREPYEWRLVRIATARHIPMNEIPAHLESLPHEQEIVVICAHGSRSYSVAAWLNEQGLRASSLSGGITEWARRGGSVEQG